MRAFNAMPESSSLRSNVPKELRRASHGLFRVSPVAAPSPEEPIRSNWYSTPAVNVTAYQSDRSSCQPRRLSALTPAVTVAAVAVDAS